MDFRELQYVVTIAACQSISQAAKQLYISQPSLSYALSVIEKKMGTLLFDRKVQPLALTPAGRVYVDTAQKILHENRILKNKIADICDGTSLEITFGIPTERLGYMLPPIITQFHQAYPDATFHIKEAPSSELLELLKKNKLSFIIIPYDPSKQDVALAVESIYDETLPLIAAPNFFPPHGEISEKPNLVDLKDISYLPFIAIKKGRSIRKKVDSAFASMNITPNVILEVSSIITATQLAACGLGYTIVTGRAKSILGTTCNDYSFNYMNPPLTWPIQMVYKKGTYINKGERAFIDLLKKYFQNNPQ